MKHKAIFIVALSAAAFTSGCDKAGAEKAYNAMSNGVQQTREWVSDKITP
jgi:hypothetical protein